MATAKTSPAAVIDTVDISTLRMSSKMATAKTSPAAVIDTVDISTLRMSSKMATAKTSPAAVIDTVDISTLRMSSTFFSLKVTNYDSILVTVGKAFFFPPLTEVYVVELESEWSLGLENCPLLTGKGSSDC
ncbi:hypothetical protein RRG08_033260 [Elysia crispata]|uniref:Uncharacterized protein n=1 Tax=Elysia crispata TaxID=231223 RepID=A0AAE1CKK7_9GAST|nr:hypothetical protein RRG08_033260 [Elysia crispata]